MEVKNDGEKNNLPLNLISQEGFLKITYHDQLIMGVFYGILFIITITYLFFFFALKERIFLYYTLYVGFVGLCQFALDGFFHQYIDQSNSWISLHAVIIFAIAGSYFFGKYSELVLDIKRNSKIVHSVFQVLYVLFGIILSGIILFPSFLKFSYPAVNILTLAGMLLIVISILSLIVKKQQVDLFYTFGISILFICFTLAIMLTTQLINVEDGFHIWSERYDREMQDIFAIQDEDCVSHHREIESDIIGKRQGTDHKNPYTKPRGISTLSSRSFFLEQEK